MSRIVQNPVDQGELVSAADLNDRYADFVQPAALNEFNLRDAAVDLPQLKSTGFFLKHMQTEIIGKPDFHHAAPVSLPAQTVMPLVPHPIQDGAGTPTVMSFGIAGQTVTPNDVMRVYWDLSVNPTYTGKPWKTAGSLGDYVIPGTPTEQISTNASCWLMWLQWDITSNALANFVPVTDQVDYGGVITGAVFGGALSSSLGMSAIPAWMERADGATDGTLPGPTQVDHRVGWRGTGGAYYLKPDNNTTIYGLRMVVGGIFHPFNNAGQNYLAVDTVAGGAGQTLEYTAGSLTALIHSLG